jgi:hypothetical protein
MISVTAKVDMHEQALRPVSDAPGRGALARAA